ncbi:MAG: ShlB/FhaC/HecB family hemolysin secretion/activation protein [Gemmatimonadaceae bacterium]
MLLAVSAVLLSVATPQGRQAPRQQTTVVRDSTPRDSTKRRVAERRAVTAEVLRSAFHDERARELIGRARLARVAQDSSLENYDARVRERLTARMAIGQHGPERIMYRQESSYHVRWSEGVGARVEVTGARIGIPVAPSEAQHQALEESLAGGQMTPIPYFPGQEAMWLGGTVRAEVDDRTIVQPLADGAEAYYTYASGDSMTWTLPDGRAVRLREIAVRPRSPEWNLAVGSLWFDVATGQLVRAAYRLAAPIDVWARAEDVAREEERSTNPIVRTLAKAIISPIKVEISAVAIEYGLFDAKFWLPRTRSLEGSQQVSIMRMPVEVQQAFSYDKINGPQTLASIAVNAPDLTPIRAPDTLFGKDLERWRDSARTARRTSRREFRDSLQKAPCDSTGTRVLTRMRVDGAVTVEYPCDVDKLVASPDFDKSLYDSNEQLFGTKDRDALIADALPFGAQALIKLSALPKPTLQYGLSMTRYNRIEGLSTGIMAEQQFGGGYTGSLTARLGVADREPNAELAFARTNLNKSISFTGYNRLVSASDWGSPLSFGSSVSALFFGRDEGFYYRASGAEVRWTSDRGASLDWRLFGEQQRSAFQRTNYSFGASFVPNIVAATGPSFGGSMRWLHSYGEDPRGFRAFSDLRLEAAGGDSTYGRAALDVTLSTSLPQRLAAALTLAGGTSVGELPPQRRWFLGGTQTIRGQSPDTAQSGNAFWMSRLELGRELSGYRLMLFGDLGWVGDRARVQELVRPMSGAGVGMSMFDGLVRFDVARGFFPLEQTRLAAYVNARF